MHPLILDSHNLIILLLDYESENNGALTVVGIKKQLSKIIEGYLDKISLIKTCF